MIFYNFYLIVFLFSSAEVVIGNEDTICSCDEGWYEIPHRGCFFVSESEMNWVNGQAYCEDQGGYIAEVVDAELQNVLTQFIRMIDGSSTIGAWIGANDLGTEGNWKWLHSGTGLVHCNRIFVKVIGFEKLFCTLDNMIY